MKKIILLLLLSSLIMFTCKKKSNGPGGSFTATINGAQFSASPIYEIGFSCATNVEQYSFTGTAADSSYLILNLSPITVGTQSFGIGLCSPGLTYNVHGGQTYYSTNSTYSTISPGSIDITSSGSNEVSGTFNATLYSWTTGDSVVITNGIFTKCSY